MKRIVLTIILLFWVGFILFLSFQTGTDTANTSMGLTKYILQFFFDGEIPYNVLQQWHMTLRLWAHPLLFFLYAVLAMRLAVEIIKKNAISFAVASVSGIALAVFSEVGKWNIPGRHCDGGEMLLNIAGVMVGTVLTLLIQIMWNRRKEKN